MLRGLYTAASGMLAQMLNTDAMANNLANASTTGYKQTDVHFQAFPEMLMNRINGSGGKTPIGSLSNGLAIAGNITKFTQGDLHETGNTLDFAMEGKGFFKVQNAKGETFYTRDGNFTMNKEGYLMTHNGEFVMGRTPDKKEQRIQMPPDKAISLTARGQLMADNTPFATMAITQFKDENTLDRLGSNLYKASAKSQEIPPPTDGAPVDYEVHQGRLEGSNTNVVRELVNTMVGFRMYEALQKNIQVHNETLGKAVNELARS